MTHIPPVTNFANRFAHIDALRAVAVLLVVVHHSGWGFVPGPAGVTVFFCISGFIITHICLREFESSARFGTRRFYLRRILKLGPPFLLAILLPTIIYSIAHDVNWWVVSTEVFFAYNWVQVWDFPLSAQVLPGSEVVWSLAVEEQFYIVFAVLWLFFVTRKNALRWLLIAAGIAIVYATTLRLFLGDVDAIRIARATDTRLDSIAWGVVAAVIFAYVRRGSIRLQWIGGWWVPLVALAMFGASLVLPGEALSRTLAYTFQSVATALVVLWGLMASDGPIRTVIFRVSEWKPIAIIGLSSYSIYLVHFVAIIALAPLLGLLPGVLEQVTAIVIGVVLGVLIWQFVERPVLRARPRIEARMLPQPAANV